MNPTQHSAYHGTQGWRFIDGYAKPRGKAGVTSAPALAVAADKTRVRKATNRPVYRGLQSARDSL